MGDLGRSRERLVRNASHYHDDEMQHAALAIKSVAWMWGCGFLGKCQILIDGRLLGALVLLFCTVVIRGQALEAESWFQQI